MAEEIKQPEPANYAYGIYKTLPGTGGIPSLPDTFVGPRDKAYADFVARDVTRVRGTTAFYYVKLDQNRRIDGDKPLSSLPTPPEGNVLRRRAHAGMALYGEQVIVKDQIDSVSREVQPDWAYDDPVLVKGVVMDPQYENTADERGSIYVKRCNYDLARVLCDQEWKFRPQPGDVVYLPKLFGEPLNTEKGGYFDVEDVSTDEARFGATGFFVTFRLNLWRSSVYEAQRKLPPRKIATDEELQEHTQ